MQVIEGDIQLDCCGRMVYHPEFHHNHRKPWSVEDLEYLCKFYEKDHRRSIAFALGRPEGSIQTIVAKLRKDGLFEYYKNLNKYW